MKIRKRWKYSNYNGFLSTLILKCIHKYFWSNIVKYLKILNWWKYFVIMDFYLFFINRCLYHLKFNPFISWVCQKPTHSMSMIEHWCNSIKPKAVKLVLLNPPSQIGEKETQHLPSVKQIWNFCTRVINESQLLITPHTQKKWLFKTKLEVIFYLIDL